MRKNLGFTLIEILVVIAIMGILMAVGIASYNRLNDRVKVEEAARSLESQLRSWQKQVDSGVGAQVCGTGVSFVGIEVTALLNGSIISAQVVCGATKTVLETFPLPNNTVNNSASSFVILPLGRGVSVAANLQIKNTSGTIQYQVAVSQAGGTSVTKLP